MFNFKKIRSLIKNAVKTSAPRNVKVITIPSTNETVSTPDRQELNSRLVACLKQAASLKTEQCCAEIINLLDDWLFYGAELQDDKINSLLKQLGFDANYYYDELKALAAAIDYFDDDVRAAVKCINNYQWKFFAHISTFNELGEELFWDSLSSSARIEMNDTACYFIDTFVNFEALGEDISDTARGKFTRYGWFSPNIKDC